MTKLINIILIIAALLTGMFISQLGIDRIREQEREKLELKPEVVPQTQTQEYKASIVLRNFLPPNSTIIEYIGKNESEFSFFVVNLYDNTCVIMWSHRNSNNEGADVLTKVDCPVE